MDIYLNLKWLKPMVPVSIACLLCGHWRCVQVFRLYKNTVGLAEWDRARVEIFRYQFQWRYGQVRRTSGRRTVAPGCEYWFGCYCNICDDLDYSTDSMCIYTIFFLLQINFETFLNRPNLLSLANCGIKTKIESKHI